MKKLISLLAAVLLSLALCAGATAETVDYTGFWLLTKISAAGQEVDPSAFGLEMYLVLNEDGTGVVGTNAQEESCTWTAVAEGLSMTDSKGDTDIVTYVNGALTISDQGMTLHFTPYYPMPLSGLTLADFSGLWTLSYIEGPEDLIDPAEDGLSMTISLSGEEGRVEMIVPGDSIAYDMFCETEEIEGDGTVLYGTFLDSETGALTDMGMVFQLYDDGMLVYYEYNEEEDNTYLYCFDKVVTE